MNMSTDQCTALKARLKDAEDQYHSLMTGTQARVVVDQNGERVEFTAASRPALGAYITTLRMQVSSCCGGSGAARTLPPASFIF